MKFKEVEMIVGPVKGMEIQLAYVGTVGNLDTGNYTLR